MTQEVHGRAKGLYGPARTGNSSMALGFNNQAHKTKREQAPKDAARIAAQNPLKKYSRSTSKLKRAKAKMRELINVVRLSNNNIDTIRQYPLYSACIIHKSENTFFR